MNNKKPNLLRFFTNLLLFFVLFVSHYSGIFTIELFGATPILPLSLLVTVCMYCNEINASIIGMVLGFFMDSAANHTSYFYTVTFFIVGFAVSFIVHFFFNKNIRSALALGFIASLFVFLSRWAFIHIGTDGITSSIDYLLSFAFPSAVFTAAFVTPFYYLQDRMNKLGNL